MRLVFLFLSVCRSVSSVLGHVLMWVGIEGMRAEQNTDGAPAHRGRGRGRDTHAAPVMREMDGAREGRLRWGEGLPSTSRPSLSITVRS